MPQTRRQPTNKRCAFREGGARCVRTVTTNGTFCRAHEIVVKTTTQSRMRKEQPGFLSKTFEVVEDFFQGKNISKTKAAAALDEVFWTLGGSFQNFRSPDLAPIDEPTGDPNEQGTRTKRSFVDWFTDAPPPPSAQDEENRRKVAAARQLLGFGPTDTISKELVGARRRELMKKWHPDKFVSDPVKHKAATTRTMEINNACDVLEATLGP